MSRPAADPVAYFWGHASKTDACWLWTGSVQSSGYGDMPLVNSPTRSAHRFSYELNVGPIPEGMHVCHRCDNPPCVNPEHLFLGTPAENQNDKGRKGRAAARSRNGAAKLTDEQYDEIIKRVGSGEPQNKVARSLGVSPQAVCQFLKRASS